MELPSRSRLPNGYGQVDIVVRAAGFSILIESKIYAGAGSRGAQSPPGGVKALRAPWRMGSTVTTRLRSSMA